MNDKVKLSISVISIALAFAFGRYSVPEVSKQQETKTEVKKDVEVIKNVKKTITEVKEKDGTVKTITTIDTNSDSKSNTAISKDDKVIIEDTRKKTRVAALIAYDFKRMYLAYGVHVSQKILGPVELGIFGINNNTFGLSVGIEF